MRPFYFVLAMSLGFPALVHAHGSATNLHNLGAELKGQTVQANVDSLAYSSTGKDVWNGPSPDEARKRDLAVVNDLFQSVEAKSDSSGNATN